MNAPLSFSAFAGLPPLSIPELDAAIERRALLDCVPSVDELCDIGATASDSLMCMMDNAIRLAANPLYVGRLRVGFVDVLRATPELLENNIPILIRDAPMSGYVPFRTIAFECCEQHIDGEALGEAFIACDSDLMIAIGQQAALRGVADAALRMATHGCEIEGES